ncbi:hypothetical protein A4A49_25170 [Nicotiana attenuata]|uniref:Uncharacterized protein n=2 Tax=Nicotiana TaxID=4085 RepID=A0A1J6I7U5_NICAT|nr:PREDICTED: uncharacterized protein LOC104217048 [Nicotiana sylvestris]OIT01109.1 hypothetical protein A4A49_25170 [Nicotiana attenuata]
MADIAMLVAEEYERRVKNSRINNGEVEHIDFFSSFSVLAQKVKGSNSRIKMSIGEDRIYEKKVFVPQTEVGVAAINGVFSA